LRKGSRFDPFFKNIYISMNEMDAKKIPLGDFFNLNTLGRKGLPQRGQNKVVVPTMFPWGEGN
jgi:hypothetical protein